MNRASKTEIHRAVKELEKQRDSGVQRKAGRAWTVEKWLIHWVNNIAEPSVRRSTFDYYEMAVRRHLVPGLGAHRIDRLTAEHVERLYARLRLEGTGAATVQCVHRTLRAAMNEAVRRGHIGRSPLQFVKAPSHVPNEIEPFTIDEAQKIMEVAARRRNGVRFVIALILGLRKGEALGLYWSDVNFETGRITVRRALNRHAWRHGCGEVPCGRKRGAECPKRFGGGLVVEQPKSKAGRRIVDVPAPLMKALGEHCAQQAAEKERAANLWQPGEWVFTQPNGRPIDPRADHDEWKDLLAAAEVRDARIHDARHTAATMLLVLNVPTRAVMDVMGWSQVSMTSRYQHVPTELRRDIATRLGGLFWKEEAGPDDGVGALVPA